MKKGLRMQQLNFEMIRQSLRIVFWGAVIALFASHTAFAKAPDSKDLLAQAWWLQGGNGVNAVQAQKLLKSPCSKSSVVVAVIDTGIDMNHPALKGALWINDRELKGRAGKDNDGNGFVNDVHGWDFASNSGRLSDTHGHGTHIAGIIAAMGGSKGSLPGVCPGVRIMALRYYNERASGLENLNNTVKAIQYAVDNGADIINYSGGGAEFAAEEYAALKRAEAKGVLVVAAAGNERSNADQKLYFPAAYNLSNILSVTAIDSQGYVLSSSNWGVQKVHVAAPGNSILSASPGGGYQFMTGTSQATAFVSGIAAMLKSERPSIGFRELKRIIEDSAVKSSRLLGKARSAGKADAVAALNRLRGGSKRNVIADVAPKAAPTTTQDQKRRFSSFRWEN